MRGFCGCKFRCFIYDFRAVYKYSDKTIVHAASGTDYQEFRSHFTGELYILTVVGSSFQRGDVVLFGT